MSPAPSDLQEVDRAFVLAIRAWGAGIRASFWERISPDWRSRLRSLSEARTERTADGTILSGTRAIERGQPDECRDALRRWHQATIRTHFEDVHPSWIARGLREESDSVRRTAVRGLSKPVREELLREFGWTERDVMPATKPVLEFEHAAQALWPQLLIADPPAGLDDPLVVRVVSELDARELSRVVYLVGLAKLSFLPELHGRISGEARQSPLFEERLQAFRSIGNEPHARILQRWRRDLESNGEIAARLVAQAGLVTVARLLGTVPRRRARWTMQHLPYHLARTLRSSMSIDEEGPLAASLLDWEDMLLRIAHDRWIAESIPAGPEDS